MLDKLKYFAKLSSTALFSFLKITLFGNISGAISFTIGLLILLHQIQINAPHVNGFAMILVVFTIAPIQSILLTLVIFSVYLIFSFAGSYVIKKTINRIVEDKSETLLLPILDKVLSRFKANERLSLSLKKMDSALIKFELMKNVKDETDNKWVRRVLVYGFKKLKIDDIDFSQENIDTCEIIKIKTVEGLKNVTKPSRNLFWFVIAFHWLTVLIIILIR